MFDLVEFAKQLMLVERLRNSDDPFEYYALVNAWPSNPLLDGIEEGKLLPLSEGLERVVHDMVSKMGAQRIQQNPAVNSMNSAATEIRNGCARYKATLELARRSVLYLDELDVYLDMRSFPFQDNGGYIIRNKGTISAGDLLFYQISRDSLPPHFAEVIDSAYDNIGDINGKQIRSQPIGYTPEQQRAYKLLEALELVKIDWDEKMVDFGAADPVFFKSATLGVLKPYMLEKLYQRAHARR